MAFLKRWKDSWDLKSLTQDELFNVIVEVITKQLDEIEKDEVELGANLVIDCIMKSALAKKIPEFQK